MFQNGILTFLVHRTTPYPSIFVFPLGAPGCPYVSERRWSKARTGGLDLDQVHSGLPNHMSYDMLHNQWWYFPWKGPKWSMLWKSASILVWPIIMCYRKQLGNVIPACSDRRALVSLLLVSLFISFFLINLEDWKFLKGLSTWEYALQLPCPCKQVIRIELKTCLSVFCFFFGQFGSLPIQPYVPTRQDM